ncbi:MAG: oxygenase MpaB family protein [Mycobacterium sp.]
MPTTATHPLTALDRPARINGAVPSGPLMRLLEATGARPTEAQLATFREYAKMADPLADDLVTAMSKLPKGVGRKQFEDALAHGIEAIEDPLPELVALVKDAERTPFWVDFKKIRRAQDALRKTPMWLTFLGGIAVTLPVSFLTERGGNQLMVRAGGLDKATAARVVESTSWIRTCAQPGAMDRFGEGFKATLRVRLIHAYVRDGARRMGGWDDDAWDFPASQHGAAATWVPIVAGTLALSAFGAIPGPGDLQAILHLWRYQSHLLGVRPELQMDSLSELGKLAYLSVLTDYGTDEYTNQMTHATLDACTDAYDLPKSGPLAAPIQHLVRRFHAEIAGIAFTRARKQVGLPAPSPLLLAIPAIAAVTLAGRALRTVIPGAQARFESRQQRYLENAVERTRSDLQYNREGIKLAKNPQIRDVSKTPTRAVAEVS